MPKYGFMISKAVDLVARKLAGLDPETINRITQILGEEAQAISDEMQSTGEKVDADILAARLDGIVARIKYEVRNQGPDPSPHEFPIFNVSHNPSAPYPNPINHLYDKRYKEAYSTFIKQNSAPKAEPEKPPVPPKPKPKPQPDPAYAQGQYQAASAAWPYMNPYATMPRAYAAQYQQQANQNMPTIPEQTPLPNSAQRLRRSSSADNLVDANTSSGEKIRVRVVSNSTPDGVDPQGNTGHRSGQPPKRSILKSNTESINQPGSEVMRQIYAPTGTSIGQDTLQELFQVVKQERPESSGTPVAERIIIIDRRGAATPDDKLNLSGQDRLRTFEIRAVPTPTTPTTPPSPAPAPLPAPETTPSAVPTTHQMVQPAYAVRPTNMFPSASVQYQVPKMYASAPNNVYAQQTPYANRTAAFYPYMYYRY